MSEGGCPFCSLSTLALTYEGGLVVAFRDRFAVSPGHTLLVPRRHVETWFDASAEEQAALIDALAIVKDALDELDPRPDGYNVGFNAGEAAGQTVKHLHVHVIPRYRGDMGDPRGGVRHVIPSKGNYLARARSLATGGEDDPFLWHLRPLLRRATQVDVVAAFVQQSGLDALRLDVNDALARGARFRVLTGDYLHITQAAALRELLDWKRAFAAGADDDPEEERPSGTIEVCVLETSKLPGRTRAFHPKSWRLSGPGLAVAFVGSSNISYSALRTGVEWNARIDRDRDASGYDAASEAFRLLWKRATELDEAWIAAYERRARAEQRPLPAGEVEDEAISIPPSPHSIQRSALAALKDAREHGTRRGLAVLATGLGKTWLAAFDVAQLADEIGRQPRVLFLAHRREILRQAAAALGSLLRERFGPPRIGWFVGPSSDLDGDLVLASVAKLCREPHLQKLAAQRFDYVVVDEVHHATAKSYQRILERLDAAFVLGLTATPERADEADLLGVFDGDRPVFRADAGEGIRSGFLVPFHYYGVRDDIDYKSIPWRNRRFDLEELAKAAENENRMRTLRRAWQQHPGGRTLVFCCTIDHAEFVRRWLEANEVRVRCVHSGPGSDDRERSVDALRDGSIDAICSVDVFNEGVDIATIDRVVMLRPTESPVVFLQQLGRGLRVAGDKTALTIIDFVGNHRVFLERIRHLVSLVEDAPSVRRVVESEGPLDLPHGCSVDLELEAKDLLRRLLGSPGGSEVERVYRELRQTRGQRPTAGEMYHLHYLPSTLRRVGHEGWFDFVRSQGDLDRAETRVFEAAGPFLAHLERAAMQKSFKMVLLEALIEDGGLRGRIPLIELAERSAQVLRGNPSLARDVEPPTLLETTDELAVRRFAAYWKKDPVKAWSTGTSARWFAVEGDQFVSRVDDGGEPETLARMVAELIELRLSEYRARRRLEEDGDSFACKVTWNQRDPILKLPSEETCPVPRDWLDATVEGVPWRFKLAKHFCNFARPVMGTRNELPDLLRGWFGVSAGRPGTAFHVAFRRSPDGWYVEPLDGIARDADPSSDEGGPRGQLVRAFPDLAAAAGVAKEAVTVAEPGEVRLPVVGGEGIFAVRAVGDSMNGGTDPIREGDWLVFRMARASTRERSKGRRMLFQVDDVDGTSYLVKRLVRDGRRWLLGSDNPAFEPLPAGKDTNVIAELIERVAPERLAPPVGKAIADDGVADAFGVSEKPSLARGVGAGGARVDGHLFLLADGEAEILEAPDRLRLGVAGRRPGETGFVLVRSGGRGASWQYLGVARWDAEQSVWAIPEVSYSVWTSWGLGTSRRASRRLPGGALDRARAWVDRFLGMVAGGTLLQAEGKAVVIEGRAPRGGVRISGGRGGFAARTVSLNDLAWVLATHEELADGEILDERAVNRRRYLDGTPQRATRWIDTAWALWLLRRGGE